jgi:uncharacterized protein (DUF1697 family)
MLWECGDNQPFANITPFKGLPTVPSRTYYDVVMPQWVCLLRAINLGARNKVGMAQLRNVLSSANFKNVRTYLQSGNVVLDSHHRDPDDVAATVRSVISDEFGVDTPILVRTPQQISGILAWCPFPEEAITRPATVHVVHFDAEPDADQIASATAVDWTPDRIKIRGLEACIQYATTMHSSRLQYATLLKRLRVGGTARNWRTVEAISRLLRERR